MTAMLLAEELIDPRAAVEATQAAVGSGMTVSDWDATSDATVGDYFSQERAMLAEQTRIGNTSAADAAHLGHKMRTRWQRPPSAFPPKRATRRAFAALEVR